MKRFILTGTPGAGKTAILRQLERDGVSVVEEAATDIIALEQAKGVAEPWKRPVFIDRIVELQKQRQIRAAALPDAIQFHDRSTVCTAALADYLGFPPSAALSRELERLARNSIYQKCVSSFGRWVSSGRPTRGGSVRPMPSASKHCMKRPTARMDSSSSPSSREAC